MTPTLTLRTATPADLSDVDALLQRAYPRLLAPDYPPSVLVTVVPRMARAQPWLLASGRYYVAVADERIVGAGGWSVASPSGGGRRRGTAHVRHVVVDDRAVRRGVGRALMARVSDAASAAGIARLECLSTRNAVPFYVACGFRTVAELSLGIVPGIDFPAILMTRRL